MLELAEKLDSVIVARLGVDEDEEGGGLSLVAVVGGAEAPRVHRLHGHGGEDGVAGSGLATSHRQTTLARCVNLRMQIRMNVK